MEIKPVYAAPAVRVFNSQFDRHFLVSANFPGAPIDNAEEEEWTY